MKTVRIFSSFLGFLLLCLGGNSSVIAEISQREYNGPYTGANLNRLAFPLGGIGTGMVCLEGSGALSHVSVRNRMDVFHEPFQFAAISINTITGTLDEAGAKDRFLTALKRAAHDIRSQTSASGHA